MLNNVLLFDNVDTIRDILCKFSLSYLKFSKFGDEKHIEKLFDIMSTNNLFDKIVKYNDNNIANIIEFIKTQYNFDDKCINKCAEIKDVDEIIKDNEIQEIVKKEELYERIDQEQVNKVHVQGQCSADFCAVTSFY